MMETYIIRAYPEPFSDRIKYDRSIVIKKGAFGQVYLGSYDLTKVSVKRIAAHRVQLKHKIDLQINLNHENVIKLYTVEDNEDFWFIATEYYSATLSNVIDGTYNDTSLPQDLNVFQQWMEGLRYIHNKELVHGNIKPDNIVISTTGQIKISSDFGVCKLVLPRDTIIMDEYENTALWMATEILIPYNDPSFDDDVQLKFTPSSDIFSSGCVYCVYATRKEGGIHPYGDRKNHLEVLRNMKEKQSVENVEKLFTNNYVASLISKMISHDPQERPSADEIIQQLEDFSKPSPTFFSKMTHSSSSGRIQFCLEEQLGEGYFGCVYAGHYDGRRAAVKVIPPDVEISSHKADLQIKFRHENVIKILVMDTEKNGSNKYIALELCAATLEDAIRGKYTKLALTDAQVMHQIATGLTYIHSMNIVHGQIKPSNILVSNSNKKQEIIKISDFGYNKTKSQVSNEQTTEMRQWTAPELLSTNLIGDESNASIKSDTFSAGVVYFYFVKRGVHPFGEGLTQIKENILENNFTKIKELEGHPAFTLIEQMLNHYPENRPEMSHVRNKIAGEIKIS